MSFSPSPRRRALVASIAAALAAPLVTRIKPLHAAQAGDPLGLEIGGGRIDVIFAPGELGLAKSEVLEWIAACANSIVVYYGRFPIEHVRVRVMPAEGRGVWGGKALVHGSGAAIRFSLGRESGRSDLERDWVLVHEMVHLAFPSVADQHHWIEEGLATYVEPIARAQSGRYSQRQVWAGLVRGLPHGLPATGDRGLDHTPTWGRTYWGGALYCLLADVETRRRTQNRFGLQHALRAIVNASGNIEYFWPLTRALEVGDAATGVPVLTELYEKMRASAYSPNLSELWQQLGVVVNKGAISLDDSAPLASTRRGIASA